MDLASFLTIVSVAAIPVLFAITLHEVAHGWVARHFGDRTAEAQGRLSLNPLRHIDPVGTILVPVLLILFTNFAFGWAKPVPVDPRYMRDPRPNMVWVTAAGPAANFAMAVLWAFLLSLALRLEPGTVATWLTAMAAVGIMINLVLGIFNLVPIPPLDGGQLLLNLLPRGPVVSVLEKIAPFGFFIVIALLATGVLFDVIGGPIAYLENLLYRLFGIRGT